MPDHGIGVRERTDVGRLLGVLARFDPRSRASMAVISALSFVTGLTEAGVLVSITTVAISTTTTDKTVSMGRFELAQREVLLGAFGLLALNLLLSLLLARTIAEISTKASLAARQELLTAFHRASFQRKSLDRVAALQEALTTYVDRFMLGFGSLTSLFAAALNLASFALAALIVSPLAAVALAVIGLLMVLVLKPTAARTRDAGLALSAQRRGYAEGATESVLLARELSVFGVADVAGARLQKLDAAVGADFWRLRFLLVITPRIYQLAAFSLAVAGLFVLTGRDVEDLAAIGAVVLLVVRSLSYGQQMLTGLQQLSEHRPYVDKLMDMMDAYESEPRHAGTVPVGTFEHIGLVDVSFAYPDGSAALTGLDLEITAGETVGIVGPSGSGKSTLVNLLLRLYEPSSGTILVNGVGLREVLDDEWHRRTAIVPQEPRLVHGTIADNIRFFRDLPDEVIAQAAAEANIADFIATLPAGYESPVGELGSGLSGGQRQRLCIARALAGHPDLLVLDEPTSALDGESEAAVQRTLEALKGRVTMVVVAHRLSTLSICDRLVVLRDGSLAAAGTPEELAASSPYYREAMRLAGL
ncbi:MAG: ATP-binding cassette subfamily protein [Acidimicrobiales bacterium]|nr:ATP-binding cassette subfamily protein [Acidimicrobiales bacterium]